MNFARRTSCNRCGKGESMPFATFLHFSEQRYVGTVTDLVAHSCVKSNLKIFRNCLVFRISFNLCYKLSAV